MILLENYKNLTIREITGILNNNGINISEEKVFTQIGGILYRPEDLAEWDKHIVDATYSDYIPPQDAVDKTFENHKESIEREARRQGISKVRKLNRKLLNPEDQEARDITNVERKINDKDPLIDYPGDGKELMAWFREEITRIDLTLPRNRKYKSEDERLVDILNRRRGTNYIPKEGNNIFSNFTGILKPGALTRAPKEYLEWEIESWDHNAKELLYKKTYAENYNIIKSNSLLRTLLLNYGFNLGEN